MSASRLLNGNRSADRLLSLALGRTVTVTVSVSSGADGITMRYDSTILMIDDRIYYDVICAL